MSAKFDPRRHNGKGAAVAGAAGIRIGGRLGILVSRRAPCALSRSLIHGRVIPGGMAVHR